ncbi:MAG: hypothetical protein A2Z17_05530 [Gammaproteobacteria bacterium RBG_16_66_13]|nr:MAG: hypothetical protein A2Z17_05530 [Gammaproteobacteria bacterium RBG_16_66_13]
MKGIIRRFLGLVGVEIYGARGGVYVCRVPHAGRAGRARALPASCWLRLRLQEGERGVVEVTGGGVAPSEFESSLVRLPQIPDESVDGIKLIDVYEYLFRQDRRSAIREWRRILRRDGTLEIRGLPDFEAIATQYVHAEQRGPGAGLRLEQVLQCTHGDLTKADRSDLLRKDVFTRESVTAELIEAGYEIASVEPVRRQPSEPAPLWLDVVVRKRG